MRRGETEDDGEAGDCQEQHRHLQRPRRVAPLIIHCEWMTLSEIGNSFGLDYVFQRQDVLCLFSYMGA